MDISLILAVSVIMYVMGLYVGRNWHKIVQE